MRLVVDSSIWIANYHSRDRFHSKAKRFFESVIAGDHEVYVPVPVCAEVICKMASMEPDNVLIARRPGESFENYTERWTSGMDESVSFLGMSGHAHLRMPPKDIWAKVIEMGPRLRMRAMDALVVVMALENRCDVLTEDKKFKNVEQRAHRIGPDEARGKGMIIRAGQPFQFRYEKRKAKVLGLDDVLK